MNTSNKSQELCHLLQNDKIKIDTLRSSLEEIKILTDKSHIWHTIKMCKKCGQLFFFEFLEFIDWENGDDPQYCTWIPIKTIEEGEKIAEKYGNSIFGIMGHESDIELRQNNSPTIDCDPEYAFLLTSKK